MTAYNSRKVARLSFVAAAMVVLLHAWILPKDGFPPAFVFVETFLCQGVTRVAVPFFFVVSGYLLFRDFRPGLGWWGAKLRRRVRSLLIPYLAWALVGLANNFLLQHVCTNAHNEFNFASFAWWLKALGVTTPPLGCYHLWFVRSLMVFAMLSPVVGWLVRRCGIWVVCGIIAASMTTNLPILGDSSLRYFAIGACLALRPAGAVRRPKAAAFAAGAAWLAGCLVVAAMYPSLPPHWADPLSFAVNVAGVAFLWLSYDLVAAVVGGGGMLDRIAPCSFFLYCVHPFAMFYVGYALSLVSVGESACWLYFCLRLVLTLAASVATWLLLSRFLSRAMSVLTGGR